MKNKQKVTTRVLSTAILAVVLISQILPLGTASAQQITLRSLELLAGAADGGSKANGVVKHKFTFTVPSVGDANVGSIKFEYCTLAAGVPVATDCTMPIGLVTNSATIDAQSGAIGFSIEETNPAEVDGTVILTRPSASIGAGTVLSYTLDTVTNPTATNQSFFVRIKTYASIDASGAYTDAGTVTASTATQIVLDGIMPESLVFCTGRTIDTTAAPDDLAGLPDCGTATDGAIIFNQLFSPTDTATSTSQFAASTNAGSGYVVTVNGPTLTSGSNTISAMNSQGVSIQGSSQFGLNLMANDESINGPNNPLSPDVGTVVYPAPNAANYRGQAATNYDLANSFKFTSGNAVAKSDNGGAGATDAQIFTVTYIANVPGSQAAGTYTTTLTYIATPTF